MLSNGWLMKSNKLDAPPVIPPNKLPSNPDIIIYLVEKLFYMSEYLSFNSEFNGFVFNLSIALLVESPF